MIILLSVAISLTIGLVSFAYGQEINNSKLYEEISNSSSKNLELFEELMKPYVKINNLTTQMNLLQSEKEPLEAIIDYCFQHADRPNPIQDLIDKGFLPSSFKENCISVKQMMNDLNNEISVVQTAINNETAKKEKAELERQAISEKEVNERTQSNNKYFECARQTNTTQEECNRFREG